MENLTELPAATVDRLSAMCEAEKHKLLSDFESVVDRSGFCDWLSYAFMMELGAK